MSSVEERLATLEAEHRTFASQFITLFSKLDRLCVKLEEVTIALNKLELDHASCVKARANTVGWFEGRMTKVVDIGIVAVLFVLLFMILKNASTLLPLIGGNK